MLVRVYREVDNTVTSDKPEVAEGNRVDDSLSSRISAGTYFDSRLMKEIRKCKFSIVIS